MTTKLTHRLFPGYGKRRRKSSSSKVDRPTINPQYGSPFQLNHTLVSHTQPSSLVAPLNPDSTDMVSRQYELHDERSFSETSHISTDGSNSRSSSQNRMQVDDEDFDEKAALEELLPAIDPMDIDDPHNYSFDHTLITRSSSTTLTPATNTTSTLLPGRLAKVVSAFSKGSTVSLRLGTYITETALDSARLGALASLVVTRRVIEGILYKADEDSVGAESWTAIGMNFINQAATLSQLFTSASFHLASSAVTTVSGVAQDSVHLLDAVFGSTESSRAIASIISLVRRELGDGAGLYALVSGLTCFSILQSRGWRRTVENIEMHVLWDVVVLDTGETLSQQLPVTRNDDEGFDEENIIRNIPENAEYTVTVDEVVTKTVSIDITGDLDNPSFAIPTGASILHEEVSVNGLDDTKSNYKMTFEKKTRKFCERKGVVNVTKDEPTEQMILSVEDNPIIEELSSSSTAFDDQRQAVSFNSVLASVPGSPNLDQQDENEESLLCCPSPQAANKISRSYSERSLNSNSRSDRICGTIKHTESFYTEDPVDSRNYGKLRRSLSHNRSLSMGTTFPHGGLTQMTKKIPPSSAPPVILNQKNTSSIPLNANSSMPRRRRSSSICTLKTMSAEASVLIDGYHPPIRPPVFPAGHITYNMAKYVRYASASYGQAFMRLLGIGKVDVNFPSSDESHHSEHYAFAHHTKLSVNDILLSSYTDSAVEDTCGIPLVHFVAVDHEAKAVVLTIRGTLGLEDILTDLTCDYEIMEWQGKTWKAHGGMLKCAMMLKRKSSRVLRTIQAALEKWGPDYGLVICGHSLGGGVGAIFGILLSEMSPSLGEFVTSSSSSLPTGRRIHCFAYGPPASISIPLRKATRSLITSVVYGLDIVPCLSLGLLRDFQSVALAFKNDTQGVVNEIKKRFLAQLAARQNPLANYGDDDDYLWSILKTLRAVMQSEKLIPPGDVYHISTNTVFESHDGRTKRATRIIGKIVLDVEKRFSEPVFGRGVFHHSPVYYERALRTLERGVSNAPIA